MIEMGSVLVPLEIELVPQSVSVSVQSTVTLTVHYSV